MPVLLESAFFPKSISDVVGSRLVCFIRQRPQTSLDDPKTDPSGSAPRCARSLGNHDAVWLKSTLQLHPNLHRGVNVNSTLQNKSKGTPPLWGANIVAHIPCCSDAHAPKSFRPGCGLKGCDECVKKADLNRATTQRSVQKA